MFEEIAIDAQHRQELARAVRATRKLPRAQRTVIERVREVADRRAAARVDGLLLDVWTASAIVQVHDALKPDNRRKLAAMPLRAMADTALRVLERRR